MSQTSPPVTGPQTAIPTATAVGTADTVDLAAAEARAVTFRSDVTVELVRAAAPATPT